MCVHDCTHTLTQTYTRQNNFHNFIAKIKNIYNIIFEIIMHISSLK